MTELAFELDTQPAVKTHPISAMMEAIMLRLMAEGPLGSWQSLEAYDPYGIHGPNMAGGEILPTHSYLVHVKDPHARERVFIVSLLRLHDSRFALEVRAAFPREILSSIGQGLIAVGNVTFDAHGNISEISENLKAPMPIRWQGESTTTLLYLDLAKLKKAVKKLI